MPSRASRATASRSPPARRTSGTFPPARSPNSSSPATRLSESRSSPAADPFWPTPNTRRRRPPRTCKPRSRFPPSAAWFRSSAWASCRPEPHRSLPGFAAVAFTAAPAGKQTVAGWQAGNLLPQVGPTTILGSRLVPHAAADPHPDPQPAGHFADDDPGLGRSRRPDRHGNLAAHFALARS